MYAKVALEIVDAPRSREQSAETLYDRYNRDFRCLIADTPDLLRQAYETRYQVYCVENEFENPQQHSDRCEVDEFDIRSAHSVLAFRPTGETIGTVRLVLPQSDAPLSFSLQHIVDYYGGRDLPVPLAATAEVSRFSISKRARPGRNGAIDIRTAFNQPALRRAEPLMSLGLIQGLVRMSQLHHITHWCAVMEPKLLRMLAAMGIHFTPVGALMDYHGMRQLCYCEVDAILDSVKRERPSFWDILTDNGLLLPAP
jgi:N-acyl amino acid synthase of PEP-CTERM/exosortase system